MRSVVIKRSVLINGRRTSISLEDEFWEALREIAAQRRVRLPKLVEQIDQHRNNINLSSAIRVFVFSHFRKSEGKIDTEERTRRQTDNRGLRARAEECRALAESLNDLETRKIMLRVASDYDLLAERFERSQSNVDQHPDA